MQPSPSLGPAPSLSGSSSPPFCGICVPGAHPSGFFGSIVELEPEPEEPLPLVEGFELVGVAVASAAADTLTPTPSRPFIPELACPGTVQRNSYTPFVIVTVSDDDFPVCSSGVVFPLPLHLFALAVLLVLRQISNVWPSLPTFRSE